MQRAPNRVMPDQFDPDPHLQTILDRLTSYFPRAIDPGLERTLRLLHDLDDPQLRIPPAIHITGTNGKGSTLAYVRAMARAAGFSCHVMTSPHLVRFNERIVVADHEMTTPAMIALFEEVERVNAGQETTSFEIITAAGFLEFARVDADLSLIEVGMGGRFDATNVIPHPLASIITVISRDHTKFLGHNLTQIAAEKAGIMKAGAPCIIGPQTAEGLRDGVMTVFEDEAEKLNVPLYRHGLDWSYDVLPESFILHHQSNIYEFPRPNLLGDHQIGNAATAAMTMLAIETKLPKPVPHAAMEQGITSAMWPGRLQKLTRGPLVDLLPSTIELWIDGGHNDTGGQVLSVQAKHWQEQDAMPLHIVMGMLNTKNPVDMAAFLLPFAQSVQTITIPDQPLSLSADELQKSLVGVGPSIPQTAESLSDAVQNIVRGSKGPCRILITGSLYLMGTILKDHA